MQYTILCMVIACTCITLFIARMYIIEPIMYKQILRLKSGIIYLRDVASIAKWLILLLYS